MTLNKNDLERSGQQMRVVGITGGVGSGKSEVLRYLHDGCGAVICQMDETAKMLQMKGTKCYERIVKAFGTEIIGPDGELNRESLAEQVFSSDEKLDVLNGIVHPEVIRWVRDDIAGKEKEEVGIYVVESALLPEVGAEICSEIWYIYAPVSVRRERLRKSRGYTDEKISSMIAAQPSEEEFRKISSAVIDNGGAFGNTVRQIGELL